MGQEKINDPTTLLLKNIIKVTTHFHCAYTKYFEWAWKDSIVDKVIPGTIYDFLNLGISAEEGVSPSNTPYDLKIKIEE